MFVLLEYGYAMLYYATMGAPKDKVMIKTELLPNQVGKAAHKGLIKPASLNFWKLPEVQEDEPQEAERRIDAYLNMTDTPTVTGLAVVLGKSPDVITRWARGETGKNSSIAPMVKKIRGFILDWTITNAMRSRINSTFAMFYLKNAFHWKNEHDVNVNHTSDLLEKYAEWREKDKKLENSPLEVDITPKKPASQGKSAKS